MEVKGLLKRHWDHHYKLMYDFLFMFTTTKVETGANFDAYLTNVIIFMKSALRHASIVTYLT